MSIAISRVARAMPLLPRRAVRLARYLRSLGPTEALLTLTSVADLIRIDRRLRTAGYEASLFMTDKQHGLHRLVRRTAPQSVARAVDVAARIALPGDRSCLRRAILLDWLLRSAGVRCDLIAGVTREGGAWKGHAWVEIDGRPLRESPGVGEHYPLFREPLSRRNVARVG